MAAAAFGVQGLPGVKVWAGGHVAHTYCIFCGSVPRHKALGKQKGCLQWEEGMGKQHWPSSSLGKTRLETEQSAMLCEGYSASLPATSLQLWLWLPRD